LRRYIEDQPSVDCAEIADEKKQAAKDADDLWIAISAADLVEARVAREAVGPTPIP
jgi:hypothetical protein